jgi:hypothetical protein
MAIGSVNAPPVPPAPPPKPVEGHRADEQRETKAAEAKETAKHHDRDNQGTKKSSGKLVDIIA